MATGAARRTADWKRLVGQMQSLLKAMPLWRLQRVGHEDIRFLYEPGPGTSHITLLPGVACHLRELQYGRCFYCERSLPAAGLLVDRATSVAVAEWSYGHAERVRAQVWLGGPLGSSGFDS